MTTESKEKLLIIDDEAPHLRALCDILSAQGYNATGYISARDALAAVRKHTFDLILTDLMMPEMNGITLLRTAQEIDPLLVGVIMTGHGTIDTAVAAMKEGALDYVLKPFKVSTLIPVLSRALALRRLRHENEVLHQRLHARTLELEAANKELETFSYSVSHDLRAPLRAIDGFTEILAEELATPENNPNLSYAIKVRANVSRMNALIDDLLRLARTTRAEIHLRPVNLTALVHEISGKLQATDEERKVEWMITPDIIAEGDPGLLRVALENLLANAWKYTARIASARIEFSVDRQPDNTPIYYVRDNGAGFDMKYAHHLFAPFQRLHAESDFAGTGVGLATVQRIVQKHGGRIWPEAAPNKGATFYFTLTSIPALPSTAKLA